MTTLVGSPVAGSFAAAAAGGGGLKGGVGKKEGEGEGGLQEEKQQEGYMGSGEVGFELEGGGVERRT